MPDITEEKIYAALGLEVPAGEQAQEVADPAQGPSNVSTETGEQAQEVADPAEVDPAPPAEETPEEGESQQKEELTPQQRRENAARRRQQEEQERTRQAVEKAVQAERDRAAAAQKDLFARVGLKNTITGQPITTMEEFNSFQQQYAAAKLQQDLKEGTLTPEGLEKAIAEHPTVKKAEEVIRSAEEARKQQEEQAARANIDAEVAKIHEIDPSISSVADLLKMPNADTFYRYAKLGLPLSEAYYLTNREKLESAKAEAARQQAMNSARSKDHLRATGGARGTGAVAVPAEDMAMFRLFNPNASEAEILEFYNKHKNS